MPVGGTATAAAADGSGGAGGGAGAVANGFTNGGGADVLAHLESVMTVTDSIEVACCRLLLVSCTWRD